MAPTTPPSSRHVSTPKAPRFAPTFDENRFQAIRKSKRVLVQHHAPRTTASEAQSPSSSSSFGLMNKGKGAAAGPVNSDHVGTFTPDKKGCKTHCTTPEAAAARKRSAANLGVYDSASSSDESTPRKRHSKYDTPTKKSTIPGLPTSRAARNKKVEIYTDSNQRLPELDASPTNPFVGSSTSRRFDTNHHKSREELEMERAVKNNEGMIWVFRGQKFLRRWDQPGAAGNKASTNGPSNGSDVHNQSGLRISQNMSKSYLKPRRLLFSPAEMRAHAATGQTHPSRRDPDEEDLMTDIESHSSVSTASQVDSVSHDSGSSDYEMTDADGPAEVIAKTSKPSAVTAHDSPASNTRSRGSISSPFDNWPRTKSRASSSRSRSEKAVSSQSSGA